ncbi:MAG: FliM/FliN family flagellar motor switch protein [Xanthomonadales bacterium]|nr:FliM/FliN family flagellar motor switch protein [Xanthomonadales bacterium]
MSTKDILSQEEIDVLLDNADSVANTTKSAAVRDEVEPYDIYSPRSGLVDEAPDLTPIPDKVARDIQGGLDAPIPEVLEVEIAAAPTTMEFGELLQTLDTPCPVAVGSIEGVDQHALISMDVHALHSLVSVLFGGDGSHSDQAPPDLTPTETRVAGRVLRRCFQILVNNLLPDHDCQIMRVETNPNSANFAPPAETFFRMVYDLNIGEHSGELVFALPMPALANVGKSDAASAEDQELELEWHNRLLINTSKASVKLQGRAAELELTIGDVLQLAPGDFIPVEIDRSVVVCAQDQPLWRGVLGVSGSMKAIHLLGRADLSAPAMKDFANQDS